ncbi:MAG: hypothetical protein QXK37_03205 [Candidatus Woesearchaeota archaeon]
MDRHDVALESAKRNIQAAEHMLNVTFKITAEPRVLIAVCTRVMESFKDTIAAVLLYEYSKKRIPAFNEDFDSMFSIFRARQSRRYRMSQDYSSVISRIREIIIQHKKSPVEFSKDGRFVICSERYKLKVISPEIIKGYVEKAKLFIEEVEGMVKNA